MLDARFWLILLLFFGCGSAPPPDPEPADAESAAAGPDGDARLGSVVTPLRYVLDLEIDPASTATRGSVAIDVRLAEPRASIDLHGQDLKITALEARIGDQTRTGRAINGPNGGLGAVFVEPLPAGEVTLTFRFEGRIPEVPTGLYRVEDGGSWYAFTQFQPLGPAGLPVLRPAGFQDPVRDHVAGARRAARPGEQSTGLQGRERGAGGLHLRRDPAAADLSGGVRGG